jgi:hypothetical protein
MGEQQQHAWGEKRTQNLTVSEKQVWCPAFEPDQGGGSRVHLGRARLMFVMAGAVIAPLGCGSSSPKEVAPAVQPSVVLRPDSTSYSVTGSHATVGGNVLPAGTQVFVDGKKAKIQGQRWSRTVNVEVGPNTFEVVAIIPGKTGQSSQSITVTRRQSHAERTTEAEHQAAETVAEKQKYAERAITIPYKQLSKDANAYKGKIVHYEGQIFQIQEEPGGGGIMLVAVTDEEGSWTDNIYVTYTGHVRGAKESIVNVYGEVKGSKSYQTQIGGETFVPEVEAKYVVG